MTTGPDLLKCSFCGKSQKEVPKLIAGPAVCICGACVVAAVASTDSVEDPEVKCSFCGKQRRQVRKLVSEHGVRICDECLALCREIIEEEIGEVPERAAEPVEKQFEADSEESGAIVSANPLSPTPLSRRERLLLTLLRRSGVELTVHNRHR